MSRTDWSILASVVGPDVPTVRANRLFAFLITDIETGTGLPIGELMDPRDG